ncbi:hypothetical protein CCR75_008424 [Bremia lactucae]|uniref:HTH La-type RNA-binding domain-containing protein n=1 Tax=Bremia lactucae TaxID=4779 RepID=A0A976FDU3_BRELC|nr:hypothetical protein CCR75_008424 [Bremia lactucae]
MSAQEIKAPAELKEAIKHQVEFYFSQSNLSNDAYLVSHMNSQMYVPVEVIINFAKIKQLTDNTALLVESVQDSTVCSLSSSKDAIKPNIKSERTTIILREIPSSTELQKVEAIFEGCGKAISVRSDVGDTWFVTMKSESEAVSTLLALRSKTFNGAAIKARLKSENVLKSFYPTQPVENVIAPTVGAPYGGRGYYASTNVGLYDNYSVPYGRVNPRDAHINNGADNGRYASNSQRGVASFGRNQVRQSRSNSSGAQLQKDVRVKSGSFEHRGASSLRKHKEKRTRAEKQPADGVNGKLATCATTAERQPVLNAANFPPLPTLEKSETSNIIKHKYAHEDIMEIVKNMDENDCMLPEGKTNYAMHPAALSVEAHPDLLRNQRTYSIEQARDAMRQGRPIRSDSVGSIDYESLMYGEDYTNEAREQRKQKIENCRASANNDTASKLKAAPHVSNKASTPTTVVGYAAAVINGSLASASAPNPKIKQPSTKTAINFTASAEKKAGKKEENAVGNMSSIVDISAGDEALAKSGAWGCRKFLDVVKAEPPSVHVKKSAVATITSDSEQK